MPLPDIPWHPVRIEEFGRPVRWKVLIIPDRTGASAGPVARRFVVLGSRFVRSTVGFPVVVVRIFQVVRLAVVVRETLTARNRVLSRPLTRPRGTRIFECPRPLRPESAVTTAVEALLRNSAVVKSLRASRAEATVRACAGESALVRCLGGCWLGSVRMTALNS